MSLKEQEQPKFLPATGRRRTENTWAILGVGNRRLVDLAGTEAMVGGKSGKRRVSHYQVSVLESQARKQSKDDLAECEWSEAAYILA